MRRWFSGSGFNAAPKKGSSLAEMVLVLCITTVFVLSVIPLVYAGSAAYKRISVRRDEESEVRVAAAFISVKLRQNDEGGAISVLPDGNGKNGIAISFDTQAGELVSWIYMSGGALRECIVLNGELPEDDISEVIAYISDFRVAMAPDGKYIEYGIGTDKYGGAHLSEYRVALKAGR
ncbi:MAG: DUF4860 domain-containing protein [Christensenellales bacterium]|jgi:competence protein ComGC